jgi:hypothetical protein
MSITRAQAEQILQYRIGGYLSDAGMTVDDSPNPWLTDPLRWALAMLGITTASIVDVTDADLAAVTAAQTDAMLDLAELRTLEAVQTNLVSVGTWVGPIKEDTSRTVDALAAIIATKRKQVAQNYGSLLVLPVDSSVRKASLAAL